MNKHYAAAISAFVVWGFFSIPLRALKAFSAGEILYFRILFSALLLFIIVFAFKRKETKRNWEIFTSLAKRKKREVILLTLAGGALLTVNWLTFIYTVNNINIKTASFSYLICPVITAVFGFLLLQERLTRLQWIAVGLCVASCVAMGINSALELGYSILTAFSYGLYLITQRRNQGFDRILMLFIQVLFSFLILNVFYKQLIHVFPATPQFYSIIILIAGLFTVLPLFLNLFALNKINSATIGILLYLNPMVNFIMAIWVFKETVSPIQVMSFLIILIGIVVFNYSNLAKIKTVVSFKKQI